VLPSDGRGTRLPERIGRQGSHVHGGASTAQLLADMLITIAIVGLKEPWFDANEPVIRLKSVVQYDHLHETTRSTPQTSGESHL